MFNIIAYSGLNGFRQCVKSIIYCITQVKEFKARAHWGKNGLRYSSRDVLDHVLDQEARKKFVGMKNKVISWNP